MRCLQLNVVSSKCTVKPFHSCSVVRPGGVIVRQSAAAAASVQSLQPQSHVQRLAPLYAKKQQAASTDEEVDLDMVALEAESDAEERMKKAVSVVADNFNTMRTGRANPAILDRIQVDYYGVPTPLKSLASIAVPDASTLLISPFDKSSLKEIEKAINESDVGINPNNDGEKIRLIIPAMTQDRRKELSKKVSKMGEDGKVAVRNIRKDVLKKLDKYEFPKDTKKDLETSIQKVTDSYVKKLDDMVKAKSDDIMKV
eukprot:GHUV01002437.1.p1 GENE.GHUV01002437.1~~GHUV01002437.1.p1  ORF type:complete len:256 (+),score=82.72 GHUV01002437.1:205-972(+)